MHPTNITFIIEKIPETTPKDAKIFITGDFNGWFPDVEFYEAKKQKNGTYKVVLRNLKIEKFNFKFTRGCWQSAECKHSGFVFTNRVFEWDGTRVFKVSIIGWEDLQHTRTDNVSLITEKFCIPALQRHTKVWIYLPPDYHNTKKNYPVIYMPDAQDLFDAIYAPFGEWAVDKTLNKFFRTSRRGYIVVGIETDPKHRRHDLNPYLSSTQPKNEATLFADFIANRLKPYIDKYYRTQTHRNSTSIIGATEAGTFALYTVIYKNETFSKAGVFSPSVALTPDLLNIIETQAISKDARFFITAGLYGDHVDLGDLQKLKHILELNGVDQQNIKLEPIYDGKPETWFWRREFLKSVLFLFAHTA